MIQPAKNAEPAVDICKDPRHTNGKNQCPEHIEDMPVPPGRTPPLAIIDVGKAHALEQPKATAGKLQADHQEEDTKKVTYERFCKFHRDRLQWVLPFSLLPDNDYGKSPARVAEPLIHGLVAENHEATMKAASD